MQQRRPRLPANDRVWVEGMEGPVWAINWSASGCCVVSEGVVRRGESLRVELPDRFARGEATVVWAREHVDGCLAGLEFRTLQRRVISTR